MYTFSKPNLITEQFLLPSGGKLYRENGTNFDGNITLRAMTTMEERMRLGSEDFYGPMVDIINECIVDNKKPDGTYKLDSRYLTIFDFDAICVKLKIITYGPEYKTYARCTKCGKAFKHVVDLRESEFSFLPDDFAEPYEIGPLPHSGDTLGCRFLRVQDRIEIDKQVAEIRAKNPDFKGDPSYTMEMERRIMSINGEDVDSIMVKKYVENMIGMDSDYYHRKIDTRYYGVMRLGFTDCEDSGKTVGGCDGKAMYVIRSDGEFFRAGRDY